MIWQKKIKLVLVRGTPPPFLSHLLQLLQARLLRLRRIILCLIRLEVHLHGVNGLVVVVLALLSFLLFLFVFA